MNSNKLLNLFWAVEQSDTLTVTLTATRSYESCLQMKTRYDSEHMEAVKFDVGQKCGSMFENCIRLMRLDARQSSFQGRQINGTEKTKVTWV